MIQFIISNLCAGQDIALTFYFISGQNSKFKNTLKKSYLSFSHDCILGNPGRKIATLDHVLCLICIHTYIYQN